MSESSANIPISRFLSSRRGEKFQRFKLEDQFRVDDLSSILELITLAQKIIHQKFWTIDFSNFLVQ